MLKLKLVSFWVIGFCMMNKKNCIDNINFDFTCMPSRDRSNVNKHCLKPENKILHGLHGALTITDIFNNYFLIGKVIGVGLFKISPVLFLWTCFHFCDSYVMRFQLQLLRTLQYWCSRPCIFLSMYEWTLL